MLPNQGDVTGDKDGQKSSHAALRRRACVRACRHVQSCAKPAEDEDDDRFEAALRLAEDDPARGAEALRSIVADDAFDPDTRFEAAARLAEVGG